MKRKRTSSTQKQPIPKRCLIWFFIDYTHSHTQHLYGYTNRYRCVSGITSTSEDNYSKNSHENPSNGQYTMQRSKVVQSTARGRNSHGVFGFRCVVCRPV